MLAAAAAVLYPVCVSWLWRHQAMVLPLTATGNGGAHGRTWIVYNMCIVYRGGNTTDILCIGDNTYFILLFIYCVFCIASPCDFFVPCAWNTAGSVAPSSLPCELRGSPQVLPTPLL